MKRSQNKFTKINLKRGNDSGWHGDNLTANTLGIDELGSGTPFGISDFGGINHFEATPKVDIAH